MKAAKIKLPAFASLGFIADFLDEGTRQIQKIAEAGYVPKPVKSGRYDFPATVRGVKEYYKKQASKVSDGVAADRAREQKANADRAEIALAKDRGILCFKSDVSAIWESAIVRMRQLIQRAKKIPAPLKPEIVTILQSVKLDESGDRETDS